MTMQEQKKLQRAETKLKAEGAPAGLTAAVETFKRKLNASQQKNWTFLLLLVPSFVGMTVLFLLPLLDVVRRSFTLSMTSDWVGLSNYQNVINNQAFQLAATNTSLFVLTAIPLLVASSLLIALFISKQRLFKDIYKAGFLIPLVIPVAAVALIWQLLFDYSGLLNGMLTSLSLPAQNWLNSSLAFWVLVGGYLWRNLGFCTILWLAALSGISPSLYEAARIDGAGRWEVFRRITLPMVLPACFTVVVLAIINSFKIYREAFLVAGSYPHESMYTIQHLFNNWFASLSFDKISAAATLVSIIMLALVLLLYRAWGLREERLR
ncbi:MAG: sugar ABC transporter permease [Coriobacteriia bacterium]|nr:sugar ABC transporter permease [Coriobacteriia bacterium]